MSKPLLAAILSVSSTTLSDAEKHFLEQSNPLGISLFARNISSPQQLKHLVNEIKNCIGRSDVLIAIDQEGGRVRRLGEPDFRPYAGQETLGRLYTEQNKAAAIEACTMHATLISQDLRRLGINLNYAPVLDLRHTDTSPALSSRCFSDQASIVTALGKIMVDTYISQAIIPCIKHLPGHGRASVDPHLNLPIIHTPLAELETDFAPFRTLNYAPCGMTAHIIIPELDSSRPITQSPQGIDFIRSNLGFKGFLISDALDMHALQGSLADKTQTSLSAGCDAICYCGGVLSDMEQIAATKPFLSDDSQARFADLFRILASSPADSPVSKARYQALVGSITPYQETYDATEVLFQMNLAKK